MKKIIVTAPASSRENRVVALVAMVSPRKISRMKAEISARLPTSPNSSENAAKMKSVVRSGMNSRCVCVPAMKPLPHMPPEPMAIMPWMMWNPLPNGSRVGSSRVQMRCCW
ncbi:hypothetical protein D3C72_1560710 [compost metagenome]